MDQEQLDYSFKYIIIGNSNTGKTCLLHYFLENKFLKKTNYTVGVEFGSKILRVENKSIKLQIWDTAGQERFRSVARTYYRGAIGAIIVYDITNPDSFNNVINWVKDARELARSDIAITVCGNKCDLKEQRKIQYIDALQFCQGQNVNFFETSALSGENIQQAFEQISKNILDLIQKEQLDPSELKPRLSSNKSDINNNNNNHFLLNKQEKDLKQKVSCFSCGRNTEQMLILCYQLLQQIILFCTYYQTRYLKIKLKIRFAYSLLIFILLFKQHYNYYIIKHNQLKNISSNKILMKYQLVIYFFLIDFIGALQLMIFKVYNTFPYTQCIGGSQIEGLEITMLREALNQLHYKENINYIFNCSDFNRIEIQNQLNLFNKFSNDSFAGIIGGINVNQFQNLQFDKNQIPTIPFNILKVKKQEIFTNFIIFNLIDWSYYLILLISPFIFGFAAHLHEMRRSFYFDQVMTLSALIQKGGEVFLFSFNQKMVNIILSFIFFFMFIMIEAQFIVQLFGFSHINTYSFQQLSDITNRFIGINAQNIDWNNINKMEKGDFLYLDNNQMKYLDTEEFQIEKQFNERFFYSLILNLQYFSDENIIKLKQYFLINQQKQIINQIYNQTKISIYIQDVIYNWLFLAGGVILGLICYFTPSKVKDKLKFGMQQERQEVNKYITAHVNRQFSENFEQQVEKIFDYNQRQIRQQTQFQRIIMQHFNQEDDRSDIRFAYHIVKKFQKNNYFRHKVSKYFRKSKPLFGATQIQQEQQINLYNKVKLYLDLEKQQKEEKKQSKSINFTSFKQESQKQLRKQSYKKMEQVPNKLNENLSNSVGLAQNNKQVIRTLDKRLSKIMNKTQFEQFDKNIFFPKKESTTLIQKPKVSKERNQNKFQQ